MKDRVIAGSGDKIEGERVRKVLWGFGVAAFLALIWQLLPAPAVNATAVLGGTVTWAADPGEEVAEGSELVRVAALAGGEAVAARSKVSGVVRETRVRVGDRITSGAVVARIEKIRK